MIAAVLCAGALAIAVRSARRGASWVLPAHHPISSVASAEAFRQVRDMQDVTFHTSDGLTLRGWFSPGKRRALVILVHGLGGDRLQLFPEASMLARHGYGFLLYDSRGNGESDGDLTTWGDREQRDAVAAIDFATARPEIDPRRVAILGFSIGGSTASLTAAKDARARAVILEATSTSLQDEIKTVWGRYGPLSWGPALLALRHAGVDVDGVRPIDHIGEIAPRPILFIGGALDTVAPVRVMQRLFDAAGEPKRIWIVPGASHGTCFQTAPEDYESRVVAFLDEALPQ